MKVVLFCAGRMARRVLEETDYEVIAIIDNDPAKQGDRLGGKKIISLEDYKASYHEYKIIITTVYADEIQKQLYENGVSNFEIWPEMYADPKVLRDEDISHDNWVDYLVSLCDKPGMKVLEVGSRDVTGRPLRGRFQNASYTGFDYYPGDNVDVAGDAHKLSNYFNEKYDLIFSSAVFEHLALPWLAAIEMIKLLKVKGYIFIETHYSYSSHARPWHFFQFSENALDVLFPEKFGMCCIKKGCSNLLEGRFSSAASKYLQGRRVLGLYCHSEYLGQKVKEVDEKELDWSNISLDDVRKGTEYPKK